MSGVDLGARRSDGVKTMRYLIGLLPGGNLGMALEGEEDEVYRRIMRIIGAARRDDIVWQVSTESPFSHGR